MGGWVQKKEVVMKCPLCRGKMVKGVTDLPTLGENQLVVVQNVPAFVCDECGDAFVEIASARKVEEILSSAKRDGITLGFIRYQKAA